MFPSSSSEREKAGDAPEMTGAAAESTPEDQSPPTNVANEAEGLIFFPCSGGLHDSSSCSNVVFVVSRSRGVGALLCEFF